MMMMRQRHQIILLIAVTLGMFYPAVFAEICLVDDVGAIGDILNSDGYTLKGIFIPGSGGGAYYRPFIGLSYLMDKTLWLMSTKAMHLDNIIMHILNVLLVYLLACTILGEKRENSPVPLIAALLFGMHPITTESVNWISGRTDLMAANFILLSAIILYRYLEKRSLVAFAAMFIMFMCAVFSKEVALGFMPAALMLAAANRTTYNESGEYNDSTSHKLFLFLGFVSISVLSALFVGNYWLVVGMGVIYHFVIVARQQYRYGTKRFVSSFFQQFAVSCSALAAIVGLFLVLRRIAFTSDFDKMSQTLKLIFQDTNYAISVFLGATAFYIKKFFLPVPLNFYIREIDPLYSLAGIVLFFCCIALLHIRAKSSALFLAGVCMVLPVLPFAFGTIAWTAFAERYIYISSAFWSLSICLAAASYLEIQSSDSYVLNRSSLTFCVSLLLIVATVLTFQRNLKWQTNLGILKDTVLQSPESKPLRGLYMIALSQKGDLATAKEQYHIASSLYSLQYDERYEINMAEIEAAEGDYQEAERYHKMAITKTRGKSSTALNAYLDFLDKKNLQQDVEQTEKVKDIDKQISIATKIYEMNHDPFILYRMGQFSLALRRKSEAAVYFSKAAKAFPPGSQYHTASLKLLSGLSK